MSLYGNIASTAPFQFDRIFGSRSEMDQFGAPEDKFVDDGVYAGRYVLVKYDTKLESAIPVATLDNNDIERIGKLIAGQEVVSDIFKLYRDNEAIKAGSTDPRLIPNQIYAASFASSDASLEARLNRYFFFEFTGDYEDQTSAAQFKFIQEGKEKDENKSKYLYPMHYAQDRENYETIDQQASSKGYDGTIWMKTYVEDNSKYKEKYVYIGSLNASMPALRVTPEAPEGGFRLPHLNVTDSDIYDLHITTPYGFRVGNVVPDSVQVKDLNGQLVPEINDKGETTGQYVTRSNSDIKWQANEASDAADGKKAIYYNKAGFDVTKNSIDDKTTNELTCDLTGYSGQRYAVCDAAGNVNESNDIPDIYELQMKLPILGNVVAELWNLAYGTERNLNIAWEDGHDPKRAGKRLLPVGETYSPQEANTIAGCINSLHDIMGMIIVEKDDDTLPTNLENYGLGYIYYFSKLKRFYRVEQVPYFNEANKLTVANGDFDFKKADNVTSDTFVKNLYYSSIGTPLDSYSANNTYIKVLSDKGKGKTYANIPWTEMLDPTANDIYEKINDNYYYVPSDLVAEGKTYYSFTAIKTLPKLYKPNTYYIKSVTNGECYQLAAEENMQTGVKYYSRLSKNDYSIKESSWVTKNSPNNSRFYYNAEISTKILSELKNLLNKPNVSYGMQSSAVFFYKDQDKVYQPVKELAAGVVYYIGVNWQPKLDWDENNAQFVYLYYPTSFYPTTLIAYPANATEKIDENLSVNYSVYYNDPSSGWRNCNIDDYAKAVAKNIYSLSIEGIHTDYEYSAFFIDNREQLVDSNTLVADNVYICDNEKNYLKATAEDISQAGSFYTLTNENTIKYIYQPNKYYIKNNGQYVLDDRITKSSVESTVWYIKKSIIIKDSAGYYPEYSIWDTDTNLIPSTVDLYIIDTKPALVELESFARQLNTAHGLILKINQTLDTSNINTREDTTVKGIMNKMNDILDKFAVMQPGDFLVVDGYGRIHGAKPSGGNWIDVKVKPDPVSPTVTFEHADPGAEGIWATPTIQLSDTQQAVVMAAKIDNKGHLDFNNVTGVDPGNLLFTVHGITRSFAEWITWAANQGGGANEYRDAEWINLDVNNEFNFISLDVSKGYLRDIDDTDQGIDIWSINTTNNAVVTKQSIDGKTQNIIFNVGTLPTNKQFKLTLGYDDQNKFSNNYTATTVKEMTFDIDFRESLNVQQLASGHDFTVSNFPGEGEYLRIDICNKDTKEVISTMAFDKEVVSSNFSVDLDLQSFDNKLEVNKEYLAKFYAEANNESITKASVFNYIRKKVSSLAKPSNLKFNDIKSADGVVTIGQKLTWDAVNSDGVDNITYNVYKDNALVGEGNTLAEYIVEKGSAAMPADRNGNYQVKAFGKSNGVAVTSDLSDAIVLSWFIQLDTPVISLATDGKTISWDAIEHADSYKLFMGSNIYTTKNLSYTASTKGDYTVKAIPSDNDSYKYFISDASNSVTVTEESVHEHNYDNTWDYDNDNHWHTCKTCGELINEAPHDRSTHYNSSGHWDGCNTCDWTNALVNHSYSSTQQITYKNGDYDNHYQKCDSCDYEKPTNHSWSLLGDHENYAMCSVCKMTCDHSDSSKWSYKSNGDGQTHSITCLRCGQTFNTASSCDFNSDNVCKQCGQSMFEECSHPNKILTNTGDGGKHKWSCPDCSESGTEDHVMKSYAVANCQHGNQLKCDCGFIDDDGKLDETNHADPASKTEILQWVDSNQHIVKEKCNACTGYVLRTEPHTFGDWKEQSDGNYERECGCGETQTCSHPQTTLSQLNSTEHTVSCTNCPASWTESHTFNDSGLCECGYQCQHPSNSYLYNSNNDGTHSITCGKCGATVEAAANCVDDKNPKGTCDLCGGPMV